MYEDENYKKYRAFLNIISIRKIANPYKKPTEEEKEIADQYSEQSQKLEAIRQRTFLSMLGENTIENNLYNKVKNILNEKEDITEENINQIFNEIDSVISSYDYKKPYEKELVDKDELEK